jgi:hypothetical protein
MFDQYETGINTEKTTLVLTKVTQQDVKLTRNDGFTLPDVIKTKPALLKSTNL